MASMDEHLTESPDDSLLREAARAPDRPILFGPFSHYTILDRLGAGGMGEVYRARDTRLGRLVALKVLPGQLADDPERLSRFVREAQAASSLNHPCIVTVYEIGNAQVSNWAHPIHYIAMELVEGETLREYLTRSTVLSHWMDVLIEVCDGLGKAHAAGIVHRDLKPDNVMVTADGRAKILDFGIAKVIPYGSSDGLGATESVSGATETAAGVVMGTVGYMAPEQVRGEPVDARADVFALGCILYEAATGKRAFEGNTAIDTLHAILHSDPTPIGHLNTLVPEALDRIVRSCLAKDRASRFPSAREVGAELRGLRERDATFARPSTGRRAARAPRCSWRGLPFS
jgi:serine/threonine protein kinase